jgi:hypothetical protein
MPFQRLPYSIQKKSYPTPPKESEDPRYRSITGKIPRRMISSGRGIYPIRSEKVFTSGENINIEKGRTEMAVRMTTEEWLKKKTFERPGFYGIDNPLQTTAPYPGSFLLGAGVGVTGTAQIQITAEADFEVVKIMSFGYLVNGTAVTSFLVKMTETASGRDLMNQPILVTCLAGTSQLPLILPVTLFINRASQITLSFTNLNAAAQYIYFTLLGIKYYYPRALNLTGRTPEDVEYKRL